MTPDPRQEDQLFSKQGVQRYLQFFLICQEFFTQCSPSMHFLAMHFLELQNSNFKKTHPVLGISRQ